MKEIKNEVEHKLAQVRDVLRANSLDAIVLRRVSSVAWITGGASAWVNTASGEGPVTAIVTADKHVALTNSIEAPRLVEEEQFSHRGWEVLSEPWYGPKRGPGDIVNELLGDCRRNTLRLGSDSVGVIPGTTVIDVGPQLARLRSRLQPPERDRSIRLGTDCGVAIAAAVDRITPGQSEFEIASHLWGETQRRGIQAVVTLVATDERIDRYRHPLPTDRKLRRYAMLVLCGRREGLVVSVTRLVHFGTVPDETARRHRAAASVDARMIAASRPGVTTGEVFETARAAYAETGFPGAWKEHHQGGVAGYEPREYLAVPDATDLLEEGMICAWNPSVPGAKSEDTILLEETGPRIITEIAGWPVYESEAGAPPRPKILVR